MHKKILIRVALLCFVVLGVFVQVFAQETITVTGVVYDESNAAVTGASIVVKGTTIGVTSDEAGKFTIQVPATAKFLLSDPEHEPE